MGATTTKALADLRRRRLQSIVLALVLFLAAASATLALSVLVESRAPFDAAFASSNGAHIILEVHGNADREALAATRDLPVVTASAGPWPVLRGGVGLQKGGFIGGGNLSGRPAPDATIDRVVVTSGRWWAAPGEAVLGQSMARLLDKGVGDTITVYPPPSGMKGPLAPGAEPALPDGYDLTVVGVAQSVSTPDVAVWTSPADIAAVSGAATPDLQMLYRVEPSASSANLTAATAMIVADLPADTVTGTTTYLDVKQGVDRIADLYVPVLLSFSVFALLAAAFTITNIVSGVVLTSYRDIGVMKAVGFTPSQVTGILIAQILVPVAVGAVGGVAVGTLASEPIVRDTAESFGLPALYVLSVPVIVAVLVITVATTLVAAFLPAWRAGRISPAAAMAHGLAPSARPDANRLRRLGMRLPGGPAILPVRLGIASGVAHPSRALMTLGALVVGVAAVTLSIGLNASLLRVVDDLGRAGPSPVRAEARETVMAPGSEAAGPNGTATVTEAIASHSDTAHSVAIGEGQGDIPQLGAIPFVGYDGDASWIGYALIEGRWFAGPGEAVAPTNVFTQAGLRVGDSITVSHDGRAVAVRLVGEIFDSASESRDNLVIRGDWADLAVLDPTVRPSRWEMQPRAGVDPAAYAERLRSTIDGIQVFIEGQSTIDESFLLFLSVVGLMGIVLVVISLGGVFNTVLLETRQRSRELAVLKAIGLTPAQVTTMVVASIVPVGLLAGLIGVPLGLLAQRAVLGYMGQVAAKLDIPPSVFDVFAPLAIVGLALLGLGIGVLGALLPAQRAARARIAPVLQAE
jgi:putative ABC transport system permease protein